MSTSDYGIFLQPCARRSKRRTCQCFLEVPLMDELQYILFTIDLLDWCAAPIANNRRPKRGRRISSHFPGRLKMAGNVVEYDHRIRKILVTKVCLFWGKIRSTQPLSIRTDSTMSALSSNEMHEAFVAQHLNVLTRVSARLSREVKEILEIILWKLLWICLPSAKIFLSLYVFSRPVPWVEDFTSEVEIEELDHEKFSVKRAWSFSATCPAASVSRSISATDCLSIIREFVGRVGVEEQFAEIGERYGATCKPS